ncbi:MAG: alpha-hydroxy-acid oxidizing protein [Pseudomonadales bacterium]|nr:alpha-hydroxy-acid oxidizing protein [Pseudomonadales bacterium]
MIKLSRVYNTEDLRRAAQSYLPRLVWDYITGGVDDEVALDYNREVWDSLKLVPRYLVDVAEPDTRTTLWGHTWNSCFGIAPMGLQGFARPGADVMLAAAAARHGIPYVLSGAGTATVEAISRQAPGHAWFQVYVAREPAVTLDQLKRARDSGVGVLVVTVDAPVHSKRERDLRNGFVPPPRIRWPLLLEMLRHPRWCMSMLRHGMPRFENWAPYAGEGADARAIAAYFSRQIPFTQTWQSLDVLRQAWPGKLVLKGILDPADALRAVDAGVDGIIISNHGGRVLDAAVAPIQQLPLMRAAVGDRLVLMLDSGLRRGSDMVKALALGADFVWIGRPAFYGVAAYAEAGADRVISLLQEELNLTLAQMGRPQIASVLGDTSLVVTR